MPRPEALQTSTVQVMRDEDAIPLLDTLNLLENSHVVNGSTQLFGGFGRPPDQGPAPHGICRCRSTGPRKSCARRWNTRRKCSRRFPVRVFNEGELFRTPLDAATLNRVRKVNFGVPDLSTFAMLGRNQAQSAPPGGHIGFSPIIPRTGEALLEYSRFYRDNLAAVIGRRHAALRWVRCS